MTTRTYYDAQDAVHGWRLIEPLGEGASAEVWKAVDMLDRSVALKILTTRSEAKKARFQREIDALLKVDGVGSMPILEFIRPAPETLPASYSMPIGRPLKGYVREHRPGIVGKVALLREIAGALVECHRRGIAHCDVKPDNIFHLDGRWVLGDFGLSMTPEQSPATEPDEFLGTRHYVAPELKRLPYRYIFNWSKCDSYSFAQTFWETLLERRSHLSDIAEALEGLRNAGSSVMDRNLYRLLTLAQAASRKDPRKRLSMTAVHAALGKWLNEYRPRA